MQPFWKVNRGDGPVVALAIHDGHEVRDALRGLMVVEEDVRLREEDPFTASWTELAATRVVALRSRFEVDLNRPRDSAVYLTPEDAWGIPVWRKPPPRRVVEEALAEYDAFYGMLEDLYRDMERDHGRFLVLDLHSYNHRRGGADAPSADPAGNPQVNVGTGTMTDRGRWAPLIDRFIADLRGHDFPGGPLDVRENVRFRGGQCGRWAHERFPEAACVLSVEVKKFFMDEWTGKPDPLITRAVGEALRGAVPGAVEELTRR